MILPAMILPLCMIQSCHDSVTIPPSLRCLSVLLFKFMCAILVLVLESTQTLRSLRVLLFKIPPASGIKRNHQYLNHNPNLNPAFPFSI